MKSVGQRNECYVAHYRSHVVFGLVVLHVRCDRLIRHTVVI